MKKTVRLTESDINRIVKRVILLERWGNIARAVTNLISKNEDDIIKALRTTEAATAKEIDDIVASAMKSKNLTPIGDLEAKLMHFYNPSGQQSGVAVAQEQVKKFLNAYSKSKGKSNWNAVKSEVQGIKSVPKQQPKPQENPDQAGFRQTPNTPAGASTAYNKLSGQRISNRSFSENSIDFSKINSSYRKSDGSIQYLRDLPNPMEAYNKMIANAIKSGDYQYISRGGFEKLGISDFREFLKNNIDEINEIVPETGRWSVNFKPIQ